MLVRSASFVGVFPASSEHQNSGNRAYFSLNESAVAPVGDNSPTPSRNTDPLLHLLPLPGLALPSRDSRDGWRRLLNAVSFSGCMSHPAALLVPFGTPPTPTNHPHTHTHTCNTTEPSTTNTSCPHHLCAEASIPSAVWDVWARVNISHPPAALTHAQNQQNR